MYNTGNLVPSSALEDMADNAQTFDTLVTQTEGTTTDRLGNTRRVFQQILMDMGFQPLAGSFQTGATITARNQTLYDEVSHVFYSWGGTIPVGGYVVPAGSTPKTTGGIGISSWSDKTDLMLRSEINIVQKRFGCVADAVADAGLTVGKIIETVGYHNGWAATADGPKGGNRYEVVSAGTGIADSGSFIYLDNGLQLKGLFIDSVVDICQFGAKGDGSTDDTTSLQNAFSFSSTVHAKHNGQYMFSSTIDLVNKVLLGSRKSRSSSNGDNGILLTFTGDINTPAVNVGGHVGIEGVAISRTGSGMRGVIINVSANVERTSFFRDLLLYGASYCIYSPSFWVYSTIFENIGLGNYTSAGIYLNCTGATGNIYTNIYSTNWSAYPTTKATALAVIFLTGSHTEATFNQINCEHSVISNACILLNGVETFDITSLHCEGIEFNSGASIVKVIDGGYGSKGTINGADILFCKMLGNEVRAIQVDTLSGGKSVEVEVKKLKSRSNDINGTNNHRFAIRGGSVNTNTPTIKADAIESDLWSGNNFLPIESTTYKPILERFNANIYYQVLGGVIYMPPVSSESWPPSTGVYPKNSIVMNSNISATGDRGWHIYGKGDFSNPQHGTITITQYQSGATVDSVAYAYFSIGDYIQVNGVAFLISNKYNGNTFTLGSAPAIASGTYSCLIADPQYRSIS